MDNIPVSGLYMGSRPILSFKTITPNVHQTLPNLNFLSTTNRSDEVTILHSYNGLMLCSRGSDFIVCNLTTQKFKVIPSIHVPFSVMAHFLERFIAFDPTKSPHYKVVFLTINALDPSELFETDCSFFLCFYHAYIYSSKTRTWKRISFDHQGTYPFTERVFCDGSVYWIDEDSKILKFNIDEEKWKIVQLRSQPLILSVEYRILWFGEFGGRLFLVQANGCTGFGVRALEMDMRTFHWNIKFTIDLGSAINTLPTKLKIEDLWGVQVLCLKEVDDQENPKLVFAIESKIISYSPNGDCVEFLEGAALGDVGITNTEGAAFGDVDITIECVHKFIESLATV